MEHPSWSGIWRAFTTAAGAAEGARVMGGRIVAWVALLGLPAAAEAFVPERYVPLTAYGVALWTTSILFAMLLSVRAIYVKQVELEKRTCADRRERDQRRDAFREAMVRVLPGLVHASDSERGRAELFMAVTQLVDAATKLPAIDARLLSALSVGLRLQAEAGDLGGVSRSLKEIQAYIDHWPTTARDASDWDEIVAQVRSLRTVAPQATERLRQLFAEGKIPEKAIRRLLGDPPPPTAPAPAPPSSPESS